MSSSISTTSSGGAAVIIRLQNLPITAKASHIRDFFHELHIPKGAVNIVGGPHGDAFIGFASDDDARLAMRLDGQPMQGVPIRLLLSSRREMDAIVAEARSAKEEQQHQHPQQPTGEKMDTSSMRAVPVPTPDSSAPSIDPMLRDWLHSHKLGSGFGGDNVSVNPSMAQPGFAVPPPLPPNLHEQQQLLNSRQFAPAQQPASTDSWKTASAAAATTPSMTMMGIGGRPDVQQWTTSAAQDGGSSSSFGRPQQLSQKHQYQQHFPGGGTAMERPAHYQPVITQEFPSPQGPSPPSTQNASSLGFFQGPPTHQIQQNQPSQQFPHLGGPPSANMFPMVQQVPISAGMGWGGTPHPQQQQAVPTIRIGFPGSISIQQQQQGGGGSTFQQHGQSRRGASGPYHHSRGGASMGGGAGGPRGIKRPFQQQPQYGDGAPGIRSGPGGWSRGGGGGVGGQQARRGGRGGGVGRWDGGQQRQHEGGGGGHFFPFNQPAATQRGYHHHHQQQQGFASAQQPPSKMDGPFAAQQFNTNAVGMQHQGFESGGAGAIMERRRICVLITNVPYKATFNEIKSFVLSAGPRQKFEKITRIYHPTRSYSDKWVVEFSDDRDARAVTRMRDAEVGHRHVKCDYISAHEADEHYAVPEPDDAGGENGSEGMGRHHRRGGGGGEDYERSSRGTLDRRSSREPAPRRRRASSGDRGEAGGGSSTMQRGGQRSTPSPLRRVGVSTPPPAASSDGATRQDHSSSPSTTTVTNAAVDAENLANLPAGPTNLNHPPDPTGCPSSSSTHHQQNNSNIELSATNTTPTTSSVVNTSSTMVAKEACRLDSVEMSQVADDGGGSSYSALPTAEKEEEKEEAMTADHHQLMHVATNTVDTTIVDTITTTTSPSSPLPSLLPATTSEISAASAAVEAPGAEAASKVAAVTAANSGGGGGGLEDEEEETAGMMDKKEEEEESTDNGGGDDKEKGLVVAAEMKKEEVGEEEEEEEEEEGGNEEDDSDGFLVISAEQ